MKKSVILLGLFCSSLFAGDVIITPGGGSGSSDAAKLQGKEISTNVPTASQALVWNDTIKQWVPTSISVASTVSDTAYDATSWDAVTTFAPSKNAVRDKIETLVTSGGALGTPSSGTLTNATGLPIAGLTASTSTALGVGSIELGHATDTTITRTGSGAIAVEGTAVLLSGGALGTPSSGTVTNLTGTASININGTVGATTPAAGTFTTGVFGSTTSLLLGTAGSAAGNIGFRNATSGTATLAPPTGALGTYTVTLPNAASTIPIATQQITWSGPTAARTYTLPDAAATLARTDAANTFTGVQTATGGIVASTIYPASDSTTALKITKADGSTAIGTWDTTNGNFGIGGTPPSTVPFYISKNQNADTVAQVSNTNGSSSANAGFQFTNDQGSSYLNLGSSTTATGFEASKNRVNIQSVGNAGISLTSRSTGDIRFYTAGPADANEKMRLSNAGGLGIGTTTDPGAGSLLVNANAAISGTTDSTTSTTGSLKTAGGLGVAKAVNVGTTLQVAGVTTLTGGGTSTTATAGDNTTQIATTAFVNAAIVPTFSTAQVGQSFVFSKTGIDTTAANGTTTDLFTVPAGKTCILVNGFITVTAVTGAASTASVFQIIESGAGLGMCQNSLGPSGTHAVGQIIGTAYDNNSGSPNVNVCATGNKVQLKIVTHSTSSTETARFDGTFLYY